MTQNLVAHINFILPSHMYTEYVRYAKSKTM